MTGAPPKIELLVVQPTPFCNIDCRYCYLPDRNSKAVISEATLVNLFTRVFASGWARDELNVVWHAGEPMVLPIAFYRSAFALVERLKPAGMHVSNAFQTNGTLITDEWCSFFAEWKLQIGVSIDGPRHHHDRNRITRAGQGTFDKTIAGIRLLRKHRVPFHVITVLTAESMAGPQDMFDFYTSEGIDQVCFNVEESEGGYVSRSFEQAGIEDLYYRFLQAFWRLASSSPGCINFIREIEDATRLVLRPAEARFTNQLTEPFSVLSVDWAGNVSTFSPELLGQKNPAYDDFVIGNVNRDRLLDLPERPVFKRMLNDIAAGVALCREHCAYFSTCGGGEPVNKLSENGSFVSTQTTYCRMTKMRAVDLILDTLDELKTKPAASVVAAARE